MARTTLTKRFARIALTLGLVAASVIPASGAMAYTRTVEPPQEPTTPTIPKPGRTAIPPGGQICVIRWCPPLTDIPDEPTDPRPEIPEIPEDEREVPDDQPEIPADEPEVPGDTPEPEVGDTVVSRPTFTG